MHFKNINNIMLHVDYIMLYMEGSTQQRRNSYLNVKRLFSIYRNFIQK